MPTIREIRLPNFEQREDGIPVTRVVLQNTSKDYRNATSNRERERNAKRKAKEAARRNG